MTTLKIEILNILLGVRAFGFPHLFLGFTRSYQLIKVWQAWLTGTDNNSKFFKQFLKIPPGFRKFFNYSIYFSL